MKNLEELIEEQGIIAVNFEQSVYKMAAHYSANYNGGFWNSINFPDTELFIMQLDEKKEYEIQNSANFDQNSMDVVMDAKTFSLCVFAMTANHFGLRIHEDAQLLEKEGKLEVAKFSEEIAGIYFDMFYLARNKAEELLSEDNQKLFYAFID